MCVCWVRGGGCKQTATGCSAHLIDDVIRQRMTPGDPAPAEGNLGRSQRTGLLLMRNPYGTAAPKLSARN